MWAPGAYVRCHSPGGGFGGEHLDHLAGHDVNAVVAAVGCGRTGGCTAQGQHLRIQGIRLRQLAGGFGKIGTCRGFTTITGKPASTKARTTGSS